LIKFLPDTMDPRIDILSAEVETLKQSVQQTTEFQAELKGIIRIGAGFMSFMTLFCIAAGGVIWSSMMTLEGIKTQLQFIKPTVSEADLKIIAKDIQELEIRVTSLQEEVNKSHK
jgi:hypothetical protein